MYLHPKELKLQRLTREIQRLRKENTCLKQQLAIYENIHAKESITAISNLRKTYQNLIEDLNRRKTKYDELLLDMANDIHAMKKHL